MRGAESPNPLLFFYSFSLIPRATNPVHLPLFRGKRRYGVSFDGFVIAAAGRLGARGMTVVNLCTLCCYTEEQKLITQLTLAVVNELPLLQK